MAPHGDKKSGCRRGLATCVESGWVERGLGRSDDESSQRLMLLGLGDLD